MELQGNGLGPSDLFGRLDRALAHRYRLEGELGSGGMATVFRATDLRHARQVAVKVLRPELSQAIGSERFLREIQIAARLSHPHILPLFDSGEGQGLLYFVMPLVEGESLRTKLMRETQLGIDEAVRLTRQVAGALHYAHRQGVVHRDIKPENILLHEGQPLVTDFGIALAVATAEPARLTQTGFYVGTPAYMSPEQSTGERTVDARTDVYALACVLYEMLAGEPPYTGPNAQAIMAKRFSDPVPSVRRLRPGVPHNVEVALTRALARVPADRYPGAGALAEALETTMTAPPSGRSVAVLPFLNLSPDPEHEYFTDGITEDVIAQLSKIGALKVISRTSVMRFKGRTEGLKEIGRTLGVEALLEGSVRWAGDRMRIVAQLIDAETDQHLWADTYDRQLKDVFAIQSDVAVRIAEALRAELSPEERSRLGQEPTTSSLAYQLYLKGRRCQDRTTEEGLRKALDYYESAIGEDPDYALAHAGRALAWVMLGMGFGSGAFKPEEAYGKAKEAIARALSIDDALGEAHSTRALIAFVVDFDWTGAEREFQRALELNPGTARIYDGLGLMLAAQERYEEAVVVRRRAQELDPLDPIVASDLTTTLLRAGRYDEALREARHLLDVEPDLALAHSTLGWAFMLLGRHEEGLAELARAVDLSSENTMFVAQLGQACAMAGRKKEARGWLRRLEVRARTQYVPPYHLAYVYTGLGEQEKAMDCLERAYEERAGGIYGVKGSFLFAALRPHPRFQALLAKIRLA